MPLPIPGKSKDNWGNILNAFLREAHNEDGTLKDVATETDFLALSATVDQVGAQVDTSINSDGTLKGDQVEAGLVDAGLAVIADGEWSDTQEGLGYVNPEVAGTLGRALRWGPTGKPHWGERVISADWYSSLNDALTAAGNGGFLRLSDNTNYIDTSGDPLLLRPGQTIQGDRDTSIISLQGPGFQSRTPGSMCDRVTLRGFGLTGNNVGDIGLDMRGLTRGLVEQFDVAGFTTATVRLGGANPTYHSSWTNTLRDGEVTSPFDGSGILFEGVTAGGAVTANNITLQKLVVFVRNDVDSIGINIAEGDTNLIIHCDVGYSAGGGTPFVFGAKAYYNTLLRNRTEDIEKAIRTVSGAGYNSIIANTFGTSSAVLNPVELVSGTQYFSFLANAYSSVAPRPRVLVNSGATNHSVRDQDSDGDPFPVHIRTPGTGDIAFRSRASSETYERIRVLTGGAIQWVHPTTGVVGAQLGVESVSTGTMAWSNGTYPKIAKPVSSLPTASSTYRGALMRVEGGTGVADGVYICVKDAADAYAWKLVTLA